MDFEEFEMKPLTEGLGFHKKAIRIKKQLEENVKSDAAKADLPEDIHPSLVETAPGSGVRIYENLPRTGWGAKATTNDAVITPSKMPPILDLEKPISKIRAAISIGARRGAADSPQGGLVESTISVSSFVIDALAVFAISLLFLASLLVITQVRLSDLVARVQIYPEMQVYMLTLITTVAFLYVVSARSLFSRTLGEWTFEYQMGKDEDREDLYFPLRVIGRTVLTFATGLVVLPILSFIARTDLAGKITGLKLYQQQ